MISLIFVILGFSIVSSSGFLLDSSTKSPQAEIVMSDSHFTTLMTLFLEERESREKLQNFVLHLQQELTSKVDSLGNCNCKGPDITDQLNNHTNRLQTELDFLRKDFNALQLQCAQLDKRQSTTENTAGRLQHDIDGIRQLKGVADLQAVSNLKNKTYYLDVKVQNTEQSIQTILSSANARSQDIIGLLNKIKVTDNMTMHLENELQKSNGRLNTVVTDINSRKQDVIALVSKTEATNHQLKSLEVLMKNNTRTLESNITNKVSHSITALKRDMINNIHHLQSGVNNTLSKLKSLEVLMKNETHNLESNITNKVNQSITAVKLDMMNKVQHLQSGLNDSFLQLDRIKNRAVLTAWATGGALATSAVIPFNQVRTSHGIHDLTSIRKEGKFTCEKSGLYLISVYVATNANSAGYYYVIKNNQVIATGYRHLQSYMITVTTIVTERLQANDTVYVQIGGAMSVYGPYDSTFSIIQVG